MACCRPSTIAKAHLGSSAYTILIAKTCAQKQSVALDDVRYLATRAREALIYKEIASWAVRDAFPKWQEGRHPHCHFRDAMGRSGKNGTSSAPVKNQRSAAMANQNDLSRSLVAFEQDNTIIAVIEMSLNSWLVAGIVPGIERHPLKKLSCDEQMLLQLLYRWRDEAVKAGRMITRLVVAFEAGRDGFWLARWQRAPAIEAYVIHPTSVAFSREHRRAKTDRLDTELLKRAFLGWLRGE